MSNALAIVRRDPHNEGVECRRGRQIAIVGDSWLGYRSMTCWTCEQRLRQSAARLLRRISEYIFIAACSMHDYDKVRTVYAVLNLKKNLQSTYCSEANDGHEASRGLFATAGGSKDMHCEPETGPFFI